MLARRGLGLVAVVLASGAARSRAEEAYFRASLAELAIAGTLPESQWTSPLKHEPRAVLDGPGEAHFDDPDTPSGHRTIAQAILLIRLPEARDAKGRVFVPTADRSGMVSFRFSLPASRAAPGAKRDFLRAKFYRCETRAALGVPGAAWFRHMSDAARKELGGAEPVQDGWWPRPRVSELEETYGLFSGGRAIAENLQLDRLLPPVKDEDLTVDVSTLQGISVAPIDWKPLVKDLAPPLDPLAAAIPDDQHALFFPSFAAMVDLMDEADASGTPILQLLEPRAEDSLTRARYERQLCLGVSDLARLLGPAVVASAAFTGSDPFLRMGSDVAVLFEARAPEVLKGYLETKHAAALKTVPGARKSEGEAGGLRYVAAVSPDRAVSSYVASRGTTIAVTNSLAQLTRLGSALEGKAPALASSDEYVFFRHRYPRGDAAEKGFLILTDATIRRWCGPVWRIADSRRTRMAAAMAELTARHLDAGLATAPEGPIATELSVPGGGGFRWTSRGPASERYGSGEFMTPIAELEVDRVSPAEASAYERFRTTYQQNWRRFFDPIAARFTSQAGRLGLDITVMPLIEGTEYRDLMDLTRGASLAPEAGDPHPEALLHLALGIRPESRALKEFAGLAAGMVPGLSPNPLGWVGGSLAFYADADPVWDQVARLEDDRGRWFRLPIAFHVASRDPLGLTAFLAALRAFIEQTAPGMTAWEALKHGETSYVKITPSERARAEGDVPEEARNVAVFYAAGGGGLTVTFSEAVLRRALDRRAERSAGKAPGGETKENVGTRAPAWLGTSVAARVDRKAIDAISLLTEDEYRNRIQERSWSNIAILNEWRRLFPAEDPLKLHERFWGVRLLCPAGGSYVWSEDWATMESTTLGHPGRPKDGPALPPALAGLRSAAFGLTFEDQGLRARVEIERETGSR